MRVLGNAEGLVGRAKLVTFPYPTFERAVCSLLKEIDPGEVLGEDEAPAALATLLAEQAGVQAEYDQARELLDGGTVSKALAEHLKKLEARLEELKGKVAEADRAAAHPAAEAWGEARGLMGLIDGAPDPDDVRVRLRTVLRRTIEEIRVLFVARGRVRLAAVQMHFVGGACRSYLIIHKHALHGAVGNRPESWEARSLVGKVTAGGLDLRDPAQALDLEQVLLTADLDAAQADSGRPRRRRRQ
jgi:hypothetical protein